MIIMFSFVISSKSIIFFFYLIKMSFKIEKDFFKLMNNSVYGKTINGKINAKNMVHIKMNSWTDKKEKKIVSRTSIL